MNITKTMSQNKIINNNYFANIKTRLNDNYVANM